MSLANKILMQKQEKKDYVLFKTIHFTEQNS